MDTLYRITDGELSADELAALTVVLMARAATQQAATAHQGTRRRRPQVRWRRLGPLSDYRSPVSWR